MDNCLKILKELESGRTIMIDSDFTWFPKPHKGDLGFREEIMNKGGDLKIRLFSLSRFLKRGKKALKGFFPIKLQAACGCQLSMNDVSLSL
jgi:hypothetical protein